MAFARMGQELVKATLTMAKDSVKPVNVTGRY